MSTSTRDAAADQAHLLMMLAEDMLTRDREHHDEMRELIAVLTPGAAPPVNVDVPYVSQSGAVLTSTMGNWQGEPTAYAYQWQMDGVDVPIPSAPEYTVVPGDVGKSARCVVTASNALGATTAPASNSVTVG